MLSRRHILHGALATAGLSLASRGNAMSLQPTQAKETGASSLITRTIPASGEQVPVIGAGTSGSYDVAIGSPEFARLRQALAAFFEGGASVIDTSPNYARSDAVLGALLEEGGWRQKTFLATKIAADSRAEMESQWAGSLEKLKTDKVELLFVHNIRAWELALPYARELKAAGKTKYVGITHYIDSGLPQLEKLMRTEPMDFIQIHYSVNAPNAARTVLPLARDKGIAVLVNRAFDDGRLFAKVKDKELPGWAGEAGIGSWAQLFLKFAISHPAVTAVIPATGRPDRQRDNLKAGVGPLLSEAQQKELVEAFG